MILDGVNVWHSWASCAVLKLPRFCSGGAPGVDAPCAVIGCGLTTDREWVGDLVGTISVLATLPARDARDGSKYGAVHRLASPHIIVQCTASSTLS